MITVSGSPAQPGEQNHLQITPDTTLIAIRDTLADWNTEDPMTLAIHRTAGPRNSLFSQFEDSRFRSSGRWSPRVRFLTRLVSVIPRCPQCRRSSGGSYGPSC